jgi:hypothetical protein
MHVLIRIGKGRGQYQNNTKSLYHNVVHNRYLASTSMGKKNRMFCDPKAYI